MSDTMKAWWKATGIRALKTAAETALSLISVGAVLADIEWPVVVSASILAAIYSFLTCIVGIPEVDEGSSVVTIIEDDADREDISVDSSEGYNSSESDDDQEDSED